MKLLLSTFLLIPFIWTGIDQQIPIVYVYANDSYNGAYHQGVIYINPNNMWLETELGYNVWTHEILHAFGMSHNEMREYYSQHE